MGILECSFFKVRHDSTKINSIVIELFDRGSLFFLFDNGFIHAVFPSAYLSCTVFEHKGADAMLFSLLVFSDILSAIWVREFSEARF